MPRILYGTEEIVLYALTCHHQDARERNVIHSYTELDVTGGLANLANLVHELLSAFVLIVAQEL